MSIQSKAASIIDHNWEVVKSEMHRTWRKLTPKDLERINSYDDLVKQLKKTYELEEEEIMEKIDHFIDKLNLEPNLTRFEELKAALYESASDAKDKISQTIQHSVDAFHDKTEDMEGTLTNYVKGNPLKVLGLGVLATVAIKKLLVGKKES